MPIYACECADYMAETLGVSRLENSTIFLLVYQADPGSLVAGFERGAASISQLS